MLERLARLLSQTPGLAEKITETAPVKIEIEDEEVAYRLRDMLPVEWHYSGYEHGALGHIGYTVVLLYIARGYNIEKDKDYDFAGATLAFIPMEQVEKLIQQQHA